MTLAETYNEIMNRVELSEEARQRILGNLQYAKPQQKTTGKVISFTRWKRWGAAAACAAVALLAAVTLQNPHNAVMPGAQQGAVTIANGIVEQADAQELSKTLGFPVPEPTALPFSVTERSYASYWGEMAQIEYRGADQAVTFRVQPGSEDISGDYNAYAEVNTVSVNGCAVTFKGNGGFVSTAIWTNNGYAYAVSADVPLSAAEMAALVASVV